MPRSSNSSRTPNFNRVNNPTKPSVYTKPPTTNSPAPPSPPQSSVQSGGVKDSFLGNVMASTAGVVIGNVIGHMITKEEPKPTPVESVKSSECKPHFDLYNKCMNNKEFDCQPFLDELYKCLGQSK